MAEVVLEGLTKHYAGEFVGLADLSLTVASGELLVLVGPSGCGKTTTLRLIAGLEQPSAGTVRIAGRAVNGVPSWQRDVALVGQRPALFPHLSVADNLAFSARLYARRNSWLPFGPGLSRSEKAELQQKVRETADQLGLEKLLQRKPCDLSGGEQQRVALGRALVRGAKVLLLDEPFASLDTPLRHELRRELHLLHRRLPVTIIHVTHDGAEALTLGDRVAVLRDGRLLAMDRPEVLWHEPPNQFVAGFLSWPAMSFLEGRVVRGGDEVVFHGPLGVWPAPRTWERHCDQPVVLGLRPEALEVNPKEKLLSDHPLRVVKHMITVTLVERLGNHAVVTCEKNACRLTALVRQSAQPLAIQEGCDAMLLIDILERGLLFDRATGLALAFPRMPG